MCLEPSSNALPEAMKFHRLHRSETRPEIMERWMAHICRFRMTNQLDEYTQTVIRKMFPHRVEE